MGANNATWVTKTPNGYISTAPAIYATLHNSN